MSEYHVVEVGFKDEAVLVQTLGEMGYSPEVHRNAVNLHGFQGDKRDQKAHIVIPRKQVGGVSNDVGFERVNKGFVLHASAYDGSWRTGQKIQQLNKGYAENKLKQAVGTMSNYHIHSRTENEKGQIEIQLRVID